MATAVEEHEEYAKAWRPDQDDAKTIEGVITAFDETTSSYDAKPYLIVTISLDDGESRAVHAFHTVLCKELAKCQPKVGERIRITYVGAVKGEKATYHKYRVRMPERPVFQPDWNRIAAETPDPEDDAPVGAPATVDQSDGDDIPF